VEEGWGGEMQVGMPLLVHGEATDPAVDFFDREAVFIDRTARPLLEAVPDLKLVLEHITTRDAAEFVAGAPPNVAATITPQHILLNRNALFLVRAPLIQGKLAGRLSWRKGRRKGGRRKGREGGR
jgi:dihydroorotase